MIHDLAVDLQTKLRTRDCPINVYDREPTKTATYARERIVIEHDGSDSFGPARGQRNNPRHRYTRKVSAKATIYAQSVKAGALPWEHRRRAERILDMVIVALDEVSRDWRNEFVPTGGQFVEPDELNTSENPAGAIYELAFSLDRAIVTQTWAGDAEPELTLESGFITSTTKVSRASGPDDDPTDVPDDAETSCG